VTYVWNESAAAGQPASGPGMAARLLRFGRLPNLRPLVGGNPAFDVVHSRQQLLLTRKPWVVDIEHAMPFVGIGFDRHDHPTVGAVIRRRLSSQSCRAIMPWTETAKRGFLQGFGDASEIARKTHVVYPAIRVAVEDRVVDRREWRGRLLFVANRPDYNFVLKGGRELLLAFDTLQRRHSKLHLTIVGGSPELARDLPTGSGITWLGVVPREQLGQLYRDADLFVMPSFSDTFGMVYLEAMAAGLPVVALDRPYTREVVRDRHTGLLAPLGKNSLDWCRPDGTFTMNSDVFIETMRRAEPDRVVAAGVAEAIETLIVNADLRSTLGAQGAVEVRTGRFSTTRRNAMLADLYRGTPAQR
jgi:glycosyltransferase involved in cell wall biosynthesis